MLRRLVSLLLLAWVLGFCGLPWPCRSRATRAETDAVVVLTGGDGRVARGLDSAAQGLGRAAAGVRG